MKKFSSILFVFALVLFLTGAVNTFAKSGGISVDSTSECDQQRKTSSILGKGVLAAIFLNLPSGMIPSDIGNMSFIINEKAKGGHIFKSITTILHGDWDVCSPDGSRSSENHYVATFLTPNEGGNMIGTLCNGVNGGGDSCGSTGTIGQDSWKQND